MNNTNNICSDIANKLKKMGIDCFVNNSLRVKYNKEFNKYIVHNDCTINVINIQSSQIYNKTAIKSSWDIFKINKSLDP